MRDHEVSRRAVLGAGALMGAGALSGLTVAGLAQAPAGKDPRILVRSRRPADYETPTALLDSYLTPVEAFYVRSHMPGPPVVDPGAWRVTLDGDGVREVALGLADLRRLPVASVTSTLECAGNGRAFFDPPVAGIQWGRGAVGTARWTGVRLRDVLTLAGVAPGALPRSVTHLWVSGGDRPFGTQPPFVRHVPIEKALHPSTLVAFEMNGVPLPPEHGFPARLIVPGWEGAYSVKWLSRLTLADRPHDGFWVSSAYRYPKAAVVPGAVVPPEQTESLTGLVVKSLITRPLEGAVVRPGPVSVEGFAWAGTTRIASVDVSVDGGASWQRASLTGPDEPFAWRRFSHHFQAGDGRVYTVLSRATDARGRTQPVIPEWNPSGYLWNAPDVVRVGVRAAAEAPVTAARSGDAPQPVELGRGADSYRRACVACHDEQLIETQRLSAPAWERTIAKMNRWGAGVAPDEVSPLARYLASRWGAR